MERYDPHYQPLAVMGRFDTITCTYVLNVIKSAETREAVMQCLRDKLRKHGVAYITVRNDKAALKGVTRKGTWQGHVVLDLPIEYKCATYIIYRMAV
jgi:chemotaxis methyl-accepting protein methylase